MSVEAITWVLNDAPDLPPNLVATLIALANHADPNGQAAAPSQNLLARYTRKKPRTIRDDLAALKANGLIRHGDQQQVAFLPADRRPVVYDLAMERHAQPPTADTDPRPQNSPPAAVDNPVDNPVDRRAAVHCRPAARHHPSIASAGGPPPSATNTLISANVKREAAYRRRTILEEEVRPPTPEALASATGLLLELEHPWRVGRRTAAALAPLVAAAFSAGWKRKDLAAHLAGNPGGVRSYTAVLRARLGDLPAPPRPRNVPQPPPRRRSPAWCGGCSPKSRMIASPLHLGKFVRCPRCHTDSLGARTSQTAVTGDRVSPRSWPIGRQLRTPA
ncbi:helix-turn-helix domain-containing protein [Catellatospora citrea]|uniref:Helix-turn-helix protein n=1 Tax=Catellatospora citrea TaxID=53366 RepID=A0A8J3K962_9ACTN|nr:helix-turn-helix domain-containing protein [Catellatospora citrea]RKE10573.1 hypothetical protein C8E86_5485 [Catellatospora citrea]GIF98762.1 hypothetical protein Cci01nite_38560 [Catellatospora citrea]